MASELMIYFDQCRCCFASIGKRKKNSLQIDKKIENLFFNLLNIELKSSSFLSNKICEECVNKLSSFCNFKKELVEKQEKLYELLEKMKEVEPKMDSSSAPQEGLSIADPLIVKLEPLTQPEIQFMDVKQKPVETDFDFNYEINMDRSYTNDFSQDPHQKFAWKSEEPEFFETSEDDSPTGSPRNEQECPLFKKPEKLLRGFKRGPNRRTLNRCDLFCDLCPYRNKNKNFLRSHILCHMSKELRVVKCKLCSKELLNRSLFYHMRNQHSDSRPFKCSSCDRAFLFNSELNEHIKARHSEKNFVCDQCGNRFASQKGLESHTNNMHPTEPKDEFPCDKCSKIFSSHKRLCRHMALHEAPTVKCNYCDKMFYTTGPRREHEKSVHLGITYPCKLCSRTYITPKGLTKHLRKPCKVVKK